MKQTMAMKGMLALCASIALASPPATAQDNKLMVRGKYLMESVVACANCHMPRDQHGSPIYASGLSGGMVFDEAGFKAYAPNITPDDDTGIGTWTGEQIAKAIREGVRPDGSVIGPPMPIWFYRNISDADLDAIIAYLKAQPPVRHRVPKSRYDIPLPPGYGAPVTHVVAPAPGDTISYGRYLANIGHCMDCHTPRKSDGMLVLDKTGAGGQVFKGPWGKSVAPNITPDESTGLKKWTDEQIAHAIRLGVDRQGRHLKPPMGFDWYKNISDDDTHALIAYLRSLEPLPFGGTP